MKKFLVCSVVIALLQSTFLFAQTPTESRPEKLNSNINSPYHESHPVISPDGQTLYFSRWKHPQNVGGVNGGNDIWVSTLDSTGNWTAAKNLGAPLNNAGHNFVCSILPDGNTILLPNIYNSKGEPSNTPGISIAKKTSSGWSLPLLVETDHYTNKSEQGSFFLSADGKTMLMSIEYYFTYGNEDLHVSFLKEDGSWTQPKNLGIDINTKFEEVSPYLAPDGVTLYFSSNGHKGYGSKDIFVTKRLDDSWQKWTTPTNLGESINTPGMETTFVVPASGDYAYIVSSVNSDAHSDIYRVPIPKDVRPEAVVLVTGKVFNEKTKNPIEAKIRCELLPGGKNVGNANSDPSTGDYKIILPGGGKNFAFYAEAPGYLSVSENFDAADLKDYQELKKDLFLVPIELGESITLQNVFFQKSKPDILEESFPELDRLVKILKDNPTIEIEIAGHTDNVGNSSLNLKLSEQRVEKVKTYLTSKGIDPARVIGKGFGGSKPIAPNDSEENKKMNRRVEFKILKK
jgi:outer membrane protein OmpA-like peptidoglycan-associated protein